MADVIEASGREKDQREKNSGASMISEYTLATP